MRLLLIPFLFFGIVANSQNVDSLIKQGQALELNFEMDRALEVYNKAIDTEPNNPVPLIWRANLYYIMGNYTASSFDCNRVLELDPSRTEPLGILALISFVKKDYPKALELYDRLLIANPKNPRYYFTRGEVLFLMGKTDAACLSWKSAERLGLVGMSSMINKHCK